MKAGDYLFIFNDDEHYETLDEVVSAIMDYNSQYFDEDEFDEWLDNEYSTVEIFGNSFRPSQVIHDMADYESEYDEWLSQQRDNIYDDVEYRLNNYGSYNDYNCTVGVVDDEDEDEDEEPDEEEDVKKEPSYDDLLKLFMTV